VASKVFNLASSSTAQTDRIEWTFPSPATAPVVPLNTDNDANPGLGGLYVAARFLGDPATLTGNNGPRLVYAPGIGTSSNSFGMYDGTSGSPVFGSYTFGQYNWTYTTSTGTTAYYVKPSRFLVEASGVIGPNFPPPLDTDGDGRPDSADNCPTVTNPTQADCDGNGVGDACQAGGEDSNQNDVPDYCECIGDLVLADHRVNGADLGALLSQWGPATASTVSDINRDGIVNGADLGLLLTYWGPCTN